MPAPLLPVLSLSLFADLVFHVLAHVPARGRVAASLYFPEYVAFCERHLGPSEERALGTDAVALAACLDSHEKLARVQLLAWLFDGADESEPFDALELFDFTDPAQDLKVLAHLRQIPAQEIELLRCAVALERQHWEKLPPVAAAPPAEFHAQLRSLNTWVPGLSHVHVTCARSLGYRGRAFRNSVIVGTPRASCNEPWCPDTTHALLQAAHEATVLEVSRAGSLSFFDQEHAALTVLRARVAQSPWKEAHSRWLEHLHLGDFGGVDGLTLDTLSSAARAAALSVEM